MNKFKRIGVLTSGGDAPGMNAAVRAIVRAGHEHGLEVYGILEGYKGLIEGNMIEFKSPLDVSNIINESGTMLYSARCDEFRDEKYRKQALAVAREKGLDGIVAIGGDGTFMGATLLAKLGMPIVGVPATIDNDMAATDYTIGYDSALTMNMEFIDMLRSTCESHARCNVVEVMGRHAGYLAVNTAIATGAVGVAIPEIEFDEERVINTIIEKRKIGKRGFIVVVSEGLPGYGAELAKKIEARTGVESRFACPAHAQRGFVPTLLDRVTASQMGARAVEELIAGNSDIVVVKRKGIVKTANIARAFAVDNMFKGKITDEELAELSPEDLAWSKTRCEELREELKGLYDLVYKIK